MRKDTATNTYSPLAKTRNTPQVTGVQSASMQLLGKWISAKSQWFITWTGQVVQSSAKKWKASRSLAAHGGWCALNFLQLLLESLAYFLTMSPQTTPAQSTSDRGPEKRMNLLCWILWEHPHLLHQFNWFSPVGESGKHWSHHWCWSSRGKASHRPSPPPLFCLHHYFLRWQET